MTKKIQIPFILIPEWEVINNSIELSKEQVLKQLEKEDSPKRDAMMDYHFKAIENNKKRLLKYNN